MAMKAEAAASGKGAAEEAVIHRIRITLTSRYSLCILECCTNNLKTSLVLSLNEM